MTKKMVKFTVTVAALAMTLLMTQCRKPNVQTPGGSYEGTSQYITFSTGDNSKITISPVGTVLEFKWQNTDKLYVYGSQTGEFNDGQYCGELRITKGVGGTKAEFSGRLDNIPDGGFIRFYYFASGFDATTHTTTVDLSSQDGTLATLANKFVAVSENIPFKKGKQYYESPLTVPYALANFDLHLFSGDGAVTMKGNAKNCISVDEHGVLQYTAAVGTNGDVTLSNVPTSSSDYYVAIMPVNGGIYFSGNGVISETSSKKFVEDKYYTSGTSSSPTGQPILVPNADYLPGVFSVSATEQVRFSKGNLQYLGKGTDASHSDPVWRFADHQWDIMGASYYDGTVGTDKNYGNVNFGIYYTTFNSTINPNGPFGGGSTTNVTYSGVIDESTNKEAWDLFIKAETGFKDTFAPGASGNGWRQLKYFGDKSSEWRYLINRVYKMDGSTIIPRYGMGKVHGVLGIILLPDDMNNVEELLGEGVWEFGKCVEAYSTGVYIKAVEYNDTDWRKLESAGAVFIPCAGWRWGTNAVYNVNIEGQYYHTADKDYFFSFVTNSYNVGKLLLTPESSVSYGNHAPIRLVHGVSAGTK